MLPAVPPALMLLAFLQGAPVAKTPSATACEDIERVELSRAPTEVAQEICVSPGLMTSVLFDTPVVLDLQDEVRFTEVIRGHRSVSFVPPQDMAPGERLRLTVRIGEGDAQRLLAFTLVAHRGQAARQVEVYRDKRPQESYQQEVDQERAKSQKLREENRQLRTQLMRLGGLRGLFLSGALGSKGVQAKSIEWSTDESHSDSALSAKWGISYRSTKTVALEVWLWNSGADPWTAEGASLVTARGEKLEGMKIEQLEAIPPQNRRPVFVETDATAEVLRGDVTVTLWDAGARTISISKVTFP